MAFSKTEHWKVVVVTEAARRSREFMDENNTHTNLKAALKRIENGTYTKCAACGEPISIKRISEDPLDTITCSDNCEKELFKVLLLGDRFKLFSFAKDSKKVAIEKIEDQTSLVSVSSHEADVTTIINAEILISERAFKASEKATELLLRLEQGEYRFCAECGEKIPSSRQIIEPISNLCCTCKEEKNLRNDSVIGYNGVRRLSKIKESSFA